MVGSMIRLTEELRLKPFRAPGPRVWAGAPASWLGDDAWEEKGRRLALRCWGGFYGQRVPRAGEPGWLFRSCIVMQRACFTDRRGKT